MYNLNLAKMLGQSLMKYFGLVSLQQNRRDNS
jgi:hypothetical protein